MATFADRVMGVAALSTAWLERTASDAGARRELTPVDRVRLGLGPEPEPTEMTGQLVGRRAAIARRPPGSRERLGN